MDTLSRRYISLLIRQRHHILDKIIAPIFPADTKFSYVSLDEANIRSQIKQTTKLLFINHYLTLIVRTIHLTNEVWQGIWINDGAKDKCNNGLICKIKKPLTLKYIKSALTKEIGAINE